MQTIKRVQTLYSYKKPDGSLYLRGVYSVDSPVGIPDMIMQDAINGRKTVRVLEYATVKEEPVKEEVKEEPEVITTLDTSDDVVETAPVKKKTPARRKITRKKE